MKRNASSPPDTKIQEHARKLEDIAVTRQQIASDYATRAYAANRNLSAGALGSGVGAAVIAVLPPFSLRAPMLAVTLTAAVTMKLFQFMQPYNLAIFQAETLESDYGDLERVSKNARTLADINALYAQLATIERGTEYHGVVYPPFPTRALVDEDYEM